MNLPQKNQKSIKKTARSNDLKKIIYTEGSLEGLQSMPGNVRPWIPFLCALIKMGYCTISATIAELSAALYNASPRANKSRSSAFAALAYLECNDFLYRKTLRISDNYNKTTIFLNENRFVFFLQKYYTTHSPKTYIIPQVQTLDAVDLTSNRSSKITDSVISNSYIAIKDQDKDQDKTKPKPKPKKTNPIRFSVSKVLQKKRIPWPAYWSTIKKLDQLLAAPPKEIKRYQANWRNLSIDEREQKAEREILPMLDIHKIEKPEKIEKEEKFDVSKFIEQLSIFKDLKNRELTAKTRPQTQPPTLLLPEEIQILTQARNRIKKSG